MSLDLVVADAMNGTPQVVEDQQENQSNLALASNATAIGTKTPYEGNNGPATLTVNAADNIYPLIVERSGSANQTYFMGTAGDEEAFRFRYDGSVFNIVVGGKQVLTLDSAGNLTAIGSITAQLQPESEAPADANLQTVQVDVNTGIFYYD